MLVQCALALSIIVACFVAIFVDLLTFLQQKGLLVEDQVIEYAGKENTFKHDQVPDNFTSEECILQLLVCDEVI